MDLRVIRTVDIHVNLVNLLFFSSSIGISVSFFKFWSWIEIFFVVWWWLNEVSYLNEIRGLDLFSLIEIVFGIFKAYGMDNGLMRFWGRKLIFKPLILYFFQIVREGRRSLQKLKLFQLFWKNVHWKYSQEFFLLFIHFYFFSWELRKFSGFLRFWTILWKKYTVPN